MFGVSSNLPAGTLGREAVWISTCGIALIGTLVAYRQPIIHDKVHDPEHRAESEPDERSRLLRPDDVDA